MLDFVHGFPIAGKIILVHRWPKDLMRLEGFLKLLPRKTQFVFEFRNPAWFDEEVYKLLKKHKAAFCVYSMPGQKCPKIITSSFVYIRMHGGYALYRSNYSKKELQTLAKEIKGYLKKKLKVYVFFNNDARGFAVKNAQELKRLVS